MLEGLISYYCCTFTPPIKEKKKIAQNKMSSLTTAIGYLSGRLSGVPLQDVNGSLTSQPTSSIIEVSFAKKGALGIKLAVKKRPANGEECSKVIIAAFPRTQGEMGQVEAAGKVIIGDELLMVYIYVFVCLLMKFSIMPYVYFRLVLFSFSFNKGKWKESSRIISRNCVHVTKLPMAFNLDISENEKTTSVRKGSRKFVM